MLTSSGGVIEKSLFMDNSATNFGGCIFWETAVDSLIINKCTFTNNSAGIESAIIHINSPVVYLVNSSFTSNSGCRGIYSFSTDAAALTYCDFFDNSGGNFSGYFPASLGQLVTVNANGDSCDIYNNIFLDPLFYATAGDSAYYLTAESPCIDAGDPVSPLDPDSTIADIGAFYYDQGGLVIEGLTISVNGDGILLQWEEIPGANVYHVYGSEEPYFIPEPGLLLGDVTVAEFEHLSVVSDGKYFYRVTFE